jgi:FKBP-type peptidyl-prolyl cis-trans isomerase
MRSTIRSHSSASILPALIIAVITAACGGGSGSDNSNPTSPSVNVPYSQTDLRVGTGAEATAGRRITVNYSGWLYSTTAVDNKGQQFDSSLLPGRTPLGFTLGTRDVIAGWNQGVAGMRVGGQRRLVLPPALGYGSAGRPPEIPPNATLIFDIELLEVS